MALKTIASFGMFAVLSACASYPQNAEDQATYYVNEAKSSIDKDNCLGMSVNIEGAMSRSTGNAKVRLFLQGNQKARDCYYRTLDTAVLDLRGSRDALSVLGRLKDAKAAEIFSSTQIDGLFSQYKNRLTSGNESERIPFDLADDLNLFPELAGSEQRNLIVERTIANLQGSRTGRRAIGPLMEYVKANVPDNSLHERIERLLPTFNVRADEITLVASVYPQYAAARREEIIARVYFQFKNGDRLLQDDILQALRNGIRGIEWVNAAAPKVTTLVIERVRNDEKSIQERTQTVTYARAEVNIVQALLLMPNNSSYLYEVVSGGSEIEYGYVISASVGPTVIHDQVIRGRVGGEYRRCQNDRIQNIFGGVTAAGFVANDDMQQRCSGPNSISMDDLRRQVIAKVIDGVLEVPTIKNAHAAN